MIPKLGMTDNFLQQIHYLDKIKGRGLFIEKPYVPMCMGFIYYSLPVLYFIFRTINNFLNKESDLIYETK